MNEAFQGAEIPVAAEVSPMKHELSAPLDAALRVRDPSPAVRIFQHARRLEIAREQGNVDAAIHEFSLMQRIYHEHFQTPQVAEARRTPPGFLPPDAACDESGARCTRTPGCWLLPGHEGHCD